MRKIQYMPTQYLDLIAHFKGIMKLMVQTNKFFHLNIRQSTGMFLTNPQDIIGYSLLKVVSIFLYLKFFYNFYIFIQFES